MNTLRSAGWKRTPGAGTWPTWLRVRSGMVLTQVWLPKAPRDFFTLGQLSVQTLLQNVTVCLSHAAPLLKKKNDYKARTHRYCRSFCVKPHWMSHCLDEDKKALRSISLWGHTSGGLHVLHLYLHARWVTAGNSSLLLCLWHLSSANRLPCVLIFHILIGFTSARGVLTFSDSTL